MKDIGPWITLEDAIALTGLTRQALQWAAYRRAGRSRIRTRLIGKRSRLYHKQDCQDYEPRRGKLNHGAQEEEGNVDGHS